MRRDLLLRGRSTGKPRQIKAFHPSKTTAPPLAFVYKRSFTYGRRDCKMVVLMALTGSARADDMAAVFGADAAAKGKGKGADLGPLPYVRTDCPDPPRPSPLCLWPKAGRKCRRCHSVQSSGRSRPGPIQPLSGERVVTQLVFPPHPTTRYGATRVHESLDGCITYGQRCNKRHLP